MLLSNDTIIRKMNVLPPSKIDCGRVSNVRRNICLIICKVFERLLPVLKETSSNGKDSSNFRRCIFLFEMRHLSNKGSDFKYVMLS